MFARGARLLIVVVAALVVVYVAALGAVYGLQRRLMYFPNAAEVAPASVGLARAARRHLTTADGETLLAWYVAPAAGRPLILYFHGNGGGLDLRGERFAALTAGGDGLLAVEYRGYGGSTGSPSEAGLIADGEATYAEALRLGFAPGRLVLMGESLGTGVAIALAARHEAGAVVLDSPYASVAEVAAWRFPMFPVHALIKDAFPSDARVSSVHAPLLVVHGSRDAVVPIRFGEKLFALANSPKQFIRVEGAGHLALGLRIPDVTNWIARTVGG